LRSAKFILPPPFYPTVLTIYKRASKVGISRLTSKDIGRINVSELLCSAYICNLFQVVDIFHFMCKTKILCQMSTVPTGILSDIFDGWALESQVLQRADTVKCNWISCASAAFRIVIQFHLLLTCKVPCYSKVMFGFAMEVSVIAKNLNAFCIKVMYILIYSETNETYIYIIVK